MSRGDVKRHVGIHRLPVGAVLLVSCLLVQAGRAEVQLRDPWEAAYAGDDASGKHVVALWQFDAGHDLEDSSGHGHGLTLRGGKIAPDGKFGGALESFPGHPVEDKPHGARAANHRDLSPKGAFTFDLWVQPKPEFADYPNAFLVDKKYVAHDDYQLILTGADRNGSRRLRANLGFGADSATYTSNPLRVETGTWYHVAFVYDGAGAGSFYLNGRPWGSVHHAGRKSITHGTHPLVLGDRIGSHYGGFPGRLDQVRICTGTREFRRASITRVSDRGSFRRAEPDATVRLALANLQRSALEGATAIVALDGRNAKEIQLPKLDAGQAHPIEFAIDTRLRPDTYRFEARLRLPDGEADAFAESFPITIVPRRPPDRFPVVMWGLYGPERVEKEFDRLEHIGFTHVLGLGADYGAIWEAKRPIEAAKPNRIQATKRVLDEALEQDIGMLAALSPGRYLRNREEFLRIDRKGKPYERKDICALSPGIRDFCRNVGTSVAQTYGAFPAFAGALIHTEVRDSAQVCFHDHDRAAYREHSGGEIPEQVSIKRGVKYGDLKGYPSSRVIADDDPILQYCQWYWALGDGWNGLNSAVHEGLDSVGRDDFWTFNDPAVRVASRCGSGGSVDYLSQWTYSYPDPIRIGLATDELFAMAGGAAHEQGVMKMTQIIWYRSGTAPIPKSDADAVTPQARWEVEQPDAPFITIAPMHLREAFWTKIARPIRGIMYHGWPSLVQTDSTGGYRFTHPQTQHELTRLIDQVIEPLGPTLLNVPGVRSDVAFLESFAAQMFAGRGTYGWGGGWLADANLIMQYAHLQPTIVYDETITQKGLEGFRVLVLADCDVLTQSVVDKIKAFQSSGGIIVGDARLTPAIKPDIRMEVYNRTKKAADDKKALLARAAKLRSELDARYKRPVDTSDADVIPHRRRYHETDYIFLVNDGREAGAYVGHHGLVMERGLPTEANVTIRRKGGTVYDLVRHREVASAAKDDQLTVNVHLGPCDGRMLMVCPQRIDSVRIAAPEQAVRGKQVKCTIDILDAKGQPVDAVIPVRVAIEDSEARPAEFSGHYAAIGGKLDLTLDIATNDPKGAWQLAVEELASGRRSAHYFRVGD